MTSLSKQHIVIIGAGMAGTRFAFELAKHDRYAITLINQEPVAGYNRIMLSPVLAGEKTFEAIALYPPSEYNAQGIDVRTACTVTSVDTDNKHIVLNTTAIIEYDKLVFATGSTPFILPLPNNNAKGVFPFRTIDDVNNMLTHVRDTSGQCVVIGGGLLGLEAANALNAQGANVTVVHSSGFVLNRQLDGKAAQLLQHHFEAKGIQFILHAVSESITVDKHNAVTGLTLNDGRHIPADCIVMSVGVRPRIALAKACGIACDKGILVDEFMCTQTDGVYAIGECIQRDQHVFGLVAPVYDQAETLVKTLTEQRSAYEIQSVATKLKVSGIDLFSAGDITENDKQDYLIYEDIAEKKYQKLVIENNTLVAAILYGDVVDGAWFFDLIQNEVDISSVRDDLLFGQAFCEALLDHEATET